MKYSLHNFEEQDIKAAKRFVTQGLLGLVHETIGEKVDEMFSENAFFDGDDTMHFSFTLSIIGNDILAAIGAAKNIRNEITIETQA